jgi:glutamate carboxypeptidase
MAGTAAGKDNVIAAQAVVRGDIRTISPAQLAEVQERMRAIVAKGLPRTEAELTFEEGYPGMAPTDGNRHLLDLYDAASRAVGGGPVTAVDPRNAGAADISFVAGEVGMAMDGIGLRGTGGHTAEEIADLRTLPVQAKRLAVLLHRLSAAPR